MSDKVIMEELDLPTQKRVDELFKGWRFARFGDIAITMPESYKLDADNFKTMKIRPDDVWVATFPRSGTTWTQELVWMVANDLDYETAAKKPLMGRYMFLEVNHVLRPEKLSLKPVDFKRLEEFTKTMPAYDEISNAPSPRYIKTHMPFSLLSSNLLDTAKVVYVARDPRDVAVSWFNHNKLFYTYSGDFKTFWNLFITDVALYCPFFPHIKEAWALRDHPNMLFLFYEDLIMDLPTSIKRVASFFGKDITKEQVEKLCDHLNIKNFKKNESVNMSWIESIGNPNVEPFIRKGKSGGWREHFDEEMTAQAESWMRENLAGSDLRFPEV